MTINKILNGGIPTGEMVIYSAARGGGKSFVQQADENVYQFCMEWQRNTGSSYRYFLKCKFELFSWSFTSFKQLAISRNWWHVSMESLNKPA